VEAVKSGDRCADCKHCRVWSTDHKKANCALYGEQEFHPDRPVPVKRVGREGREY
jgi:hypothetical protein